MGILRTLLAAAVMLWHAGVVSAFKPMIGPTAVQAFYLISGFYIALVFNEHYVANFSNPARVFWLNRYLRLAPSYLITSLIALVVTRAAQFQDIDSRTLIILILSHASMIGQDIWIFLAYRTSDNLLYFLRLPLEAALQTLPSDTRHGGNLLLIPQGWSIGVELWFYLIAPAIVRRSFKIIALIILSALTLRFGFYALTGLKADPWSYRFFPFEIAVFLLGVLAYHGYKQIVEFRSRSYIEVIVFTSFIVVTLSHWYLPGGQQEKRYGYLLLLTISLPFIFHLTRDWKLDRMIGELSFPIYIVHMLVLSLLPGIHGVLASIVVAIFLVISIETPVEALRRRITSRWDRRQARNLR